MRKRQGPGPSGHCPRDESVFGVCECAGNVSEWIDDPTADKDPVAGGHYLSPPQMCRLASRGHISRGSASQTVGVRLVRTAQSEPSPPGGTQ